MEQVRVGEVLLTRLTEDQDAFDAARMYWANNVTRRELNFSAALRDLVPDESVRKNAYRTADYFSQYASAELVELPCPRCGGTLGPVPVKGRQHAREVWRHQKFPAMGQAIQCNDCDSSTERWIDRQSERELPAAFTLDQLLAVLALRDADVLAPIMPGDRMLEVLGDPESSALLTVVVPFQATKPGALLPEGGYYSTRFSWQAAGTGTPQERYEALLASLDHQLSHANHFNATEIQEAALKAIQEEVVAYFRFGLEDRKLGKPDPAQTQRLQDAVAAHWDELNLGNFYNAGWTVLRGMADRKMQAPSMGRKSLAGYAVNEFIRAAEAMRSGAWEKREFQQPTRLPHQPRSLPLFRTILGLDIMTTNQKDIAALPYPEAVDEVNDSAEQAGAIFDAFESLVRTRIDQASEAKAKMLENFLSVFEMNRGMGYSENTCFAASICATDMLRGYVPEASIELLQEELLDMWEAAATTSSVQ